MAHRQPPQDVARLRAIALGVVTFITVLWAVQAVLTITGWNAAPLGLRPGVPWGLVGILTAPLIHGSWGHLISNTPALLILGTAMIYGTPAASRLALPVIWFGSGVGMWLFARESVHIGASGLTYGMMFFVFIVGILRRDRRSIALAMLVFFLYGSMIWGVFPTSPGISFEYHLFGALAGAACAFLLRERDPLPARKRYDWEDEDDKEEWGLDADATEEELFFARRRPGEHDD
ncbi:rhomboid family intramembrane serine protease [Ectothiorhodospiraceae bacterium WFHF3C12]|nr:rhomboid family intramembrane serine protease [Ectothiorhodospiraceae bacterium WFHF3C12]